MVKEATTIDMLMNNAKTIGGVIGVEHALDQKLQAKGHLSPPDEFFLDNKDI